MIAVSYPSPVIELASHANFSLSSGGHIGHKSSATHLIDGMDSKTKDDFYTYCFHTKFDDPVRVTLTM